MKKDKFRFNIKFCPADPRHQKTVQVLNEAGRRKASLIVDAVYEYLLRHDGTDAANTFPSRNNTNDKDSISETDEKESNETSPEKNAFDDDISKAVLNGMSVFLKGETSI